MAKVLNPFMAGDARGSVGSFCASRNRSGAVLRQKVSPVQPRTHLQQKQRYSLQYVNQQFQSLEAAQIQAWNDFATANPRPDVFGSSIARTGLNWFVALNTRLFYTGTALITVPPATANPDYDPVLDAIIDVSPADLVLTFDADPTTAQTIWVQSAINQPLSRNFLSKSTRQTVIATSSDTGQVVIAAAATLVSGSQNHVTAFAVDVYGRATPKQRWTVANA